MKHSIIYLGLLLINGCGQLTKEPKGINFAFDRGNSVFFYLANSKELIQIENASDPAFSPTSEKLAYTEYYQDAQTNSAGSNRRIAILNLESLETRHIDAPSKQYYGPVWSEDGKYIAFSIYEDNMGWSVGIFDQNNVIKIIRPSSLKGYFSPTWEPDETILTHNLETLFFISISGQIKQTLSLAESFKNANISSAAKFEIAHGGQFIIYQGRNGNKECPFSHEPSTSLYSYDLKTGRSKQITPNELLFCNNFELTENKIWFTAVSQCNKIMTNNLYTIDYSGANLRREYNDVGRISIKNAL